MSVAAMIQRLGNALQALAPERDWKWITRGASRLQASAKSGCDQDAKLRSPRQLLDLGRDLMNQAQAMEPGRDAAFLYADGLMIAFLSCAPIRAGNLAAMRIGRHLVGHAGGWEVRFTGAETKNGRPLDFSWPDHLATALNIYLEDYRHLLNLDTTGADLDRLWLSAKGVALNANSISDRVGRRTETHFGVKIRPHMFRKAAATLVSEADPENITDAAAILGHATIETTQRHYNRANGLAAHSAYQQAVLDLRRS